MISSPSQSSASSHFPLAPGSCIASWGKTGSDANSCAAEVSSPHSTCGATPGALGVPPSASPLSSGEGSTVENANCPSGSGVTTGSAWGANAGTAPVVWLRLSRASKARVSASTMSQASFRVAWAKASSPRESTARGSAPSPSNSSTTAARPLPAAMMSGVAPEPSRASISSPLFR